MHVLPLPLRSILPQAHHPNLGSDALPKGALSSALNRPLQTPLTSRTGRLQFARGVDCPSVHSIEILLHMHARAKTLRPPPK